MQAATHIGTSGWQYKHWKGMFYPDELKIQDWLTYYSQHFDCVEVNSSFYAMPGTDAITGWCSCVPSEFIFSLKAPRRITHFKKLKNCDAELDELFRQLDEFGSHRGPVLFQLPPRWRCNLRRLESFLDKLPAGHRVVFEFRDHSWHTDEVYALLSSRSITFCIFDNGGFTAPLSGRYRPDLHSTARARHPRCQQLPRAWIAHLGRSRPRVEPQVEGGFSVLRQR